MRKLDLTTEISNLAFHHARDSVLRTTDLSMSKSSILFRQLPCSPTLRCGDLLKLIVPISWAIFGFMAMLAYMIAPLARGDSPRWSTMLLVASAIIPGVGAAITIWKHHRYESYTQLSTKLLSGNVEDEEQTQSEINNFINVRAQLKCELYLAIFVLVASVIGIIFFSAIAPGIQACAHATCGADVSWSVITFFGSVIWIIAIRLGLQWTNKAAVRAVQSRIDAADEMKQAGREMSMTQGSVEVENENQIHDPKDISIVSVSVDADGSGNV